MRNPKHSVFPLAAMVCLTWSVAAGAPPAWGESAVVRRIEGLEAPGSQANGMPERLLPTGDRFVYVARSGASQAPSRLLLWASDGGEAGTEILRELCVGCGLSASASTGKVAFFAVCEDSWCGSDRGESRLWRSDGSRGGTYPLTLSFRGFVHGLVVAGDFAYLLACGGSQCSVTASDGTVEGTRPLDIPGPVAWTDSLTAWKDEVYLSSEDPSDYSGTLWRLSARGGKVERLRDFPFKPCLAAAPSIGRLLLVLGSDLWVSDGTGAGTTLLRRFQNIDRPPTGNCAVADRGGLAWFVASEKETGEQLWSTDGTPAGTRRATNVQGRDLFSYEFRSTLDDQFARVGSRFLFPVPEQDGQRRLWTTNGFWRGARPVDGCPGGCPDVVPSQPFAPLGGRVAFIGQRPGEPVAMWITDGTGRGTVKVHDVPAAERWAPEYLPWVTTREGLWYLSTPIDSESWPRRNRLWASDGSRAGTVALATTENVDEAGKLESMLFGRAGRVYFPGCARGDCGLLATDGRAADAVRTVTFEAESALSGLLAHAGSHALLLGSDGAFWLADATAATPLPESATGYFEMEENWDLKVVANRDRTFVRASYWRSASSGTSFWSTDGTAAGTRVLEELSSTVSKMVPWRDGRSALFISTRYTSTGRRVENLGTTDGTVAGTMRFARLPANLYPGALITHGAVALLVLSSSGTLDYDPRLWISDGTAAGTRELTSAFATLDTPVVLGERAYALASRADGGPILLVIDLASRAVSEVPLAPLGIAHAADLTAAAGRLWLTARAADETEWSLWVSDGTRAGTQRLAVTLAPRPIGATGVSPLVTALDGAVYFKAADAVHGRELWRSDGTGAGTALVADLAPGLASGAPQSNIVAWRGRLYFAADDGVHGQELWSSNGTAAGTRLEVDLAAGPAGSSPTDLTVAGDHLFFAADDGVSGWQVWVMDSVRP